MRVITSKEVQIHEECSCGSNSVFSDSFQIKWKELSAFGIKRKKDRKTGEYFFSQHILYSECDRCNPDN